MTDEVKPVTPAAEVPVTPATPATPAAPEERVYTELEQRALDQGWRPIEEWDGAPEDHRSAREYIDRGELLGKIKAQNSEMKEVKQMLTTLSAHNQKVYLAGFEKGLAEFKTARAQALRDGDTEAVLALEDKIDEHKEAIQVIKNTPPPQAKIQDEPSPLFTNWLERNKWYETDEGMRNWADGAALALGKQARLLGKQIGEKDVYEHLTTEARKIFPQKFQRVGAPTIDGEGRKIMTNKSGKAGGDKFEQLMNEMPEEMAKAARNLVKAGHVTKEKYVEDFDLIGGR